MRERKKGIERERERESKSERGNDRNRKREKDATAYFQYVCNVKELEPDI